MNNHTLKPNTCLQGKSYTYTIQKVLGQGTFGITYLATTKVKVAGALGSLETTMQVAVKEFFMKEINGRHDNTVTSGSQGGLYDKYKQKFAREAENLSKLHHSNIVKVLEYFEANNTVYYAMEYMEGGSLDDYIKQKNGLPESEAVKYARQIGEALSYMHAHKMLHLDLKPGNVMLRKNGDAVLIDFGLSKQYDEEGRPETSTSVGGGTPGYAPIEQSDYHEGKSFPVTMDVYALGATLFKMLTGVRPLEASTILNDGFPAYELQQRKVSDSLIAFVAQSMSPMKKDRPQSMKEFLMSLDKKDVEEDVLSQEDTVIFTPVEKEPFDIIRSSAFRKNKKVILSLVLLVVLVIGGIIMVNMVLKPDSATNSSNAVTIDLRKDDVKKERTSAEIIEDAKAGDAKAQFKLGRMYYYGSQEIVQNDSMALVWYQKAAEQGNADAQYAIGQMYAIGFGVPKNMAKAIEWYKKAGYQGSIAAQLALAWYYKDNVENYTEAIKWFRKAAEQNDAEAQYELGWIYRWGKGVPVNKAEAKKWYQKAAEQGHTYAKESLQDLENE